ncbi:MAG TPA: DUF3592 domain-containing protein [Vicinamibacterales bacterium]|jgi:hypothetical protein|nr:DUF3592 domain-containing protein [Vicinamibacterales bacterium]
MVTLVLSVCLAGVGAVGLVCAVRDLMRAMSSRRWPIAEAIITSSVIRERRGGMTAKTFEPVVEYRYAFHEQTYVGHRLAFGDVSSRSREDADRVAARFAVGTQWEVSVNERRPRLAVLHAGPTGRLWFGLVFFAGFTLAAVVALVGALHDLR